VGILKAGFGLLLLLALACFPENDWGDLAEYEGERPLEFLYITTNKTPDIQWLGGRVAAVGVNKGTAAALDETLVWLMTAPEDIISSYVTYGDNTDYAMLDSFNATFADSIEDNVKYTYWVAERSAFDAGLDSTSQASYAFGDTTHRLKYIMPGLAGGQQDFSGNLLAKLSIQRAESFDSEHFILGWTPASEGFNQLAVRKGSTGGVTDLIWWVTTADSTDSIYPPVTIGEVPVSTTVTVLHEWSGVGFESGTTYFIWMSNSRWNEGNFSSKARGYVWFVFGMP